jgi:hypothetical protein
MLASVSSGKNSKSCVVCTHLLREAHWSDPFAASTYQCAVFTLCIRYHLTACCTLWHLSYITYQRVELYIAAGASLVQQGALSIAGACSAGLKLYTLV